MKTLIIVISTISIVTYLVLSQQKYQTSEVDKMVETINKSGGDVEEIKRLIKYKNWHSVDASFSLHYHANLYKVYLKFPQELKSLQDSYPDLIEKVIKRGRYDHETYYQNEEIK